jgi:chromosome segregation ATPase
MAEPTSSVWREAGEAVVLILGGVGGALGWKARKSRTEQAESSNDLDRWRSDVDEWRDRTDNALESLRTNQAVAKGAFEHLQDDVRDVKDRVESIQENVVQILVRLGGQPK